MRGCLARRGGARDELGARGGERERGEDDADAGRHLHRGLPAGFRQGPPHLLARVRHRCAMTPLPMNPSNDGALTQVRSASKAIIGVQITCFVP